MAYGTAIKTLLKQCKINLKHNCSRKKVCRIIHKTHLENKGKKGQTGKQQHTVSGVLFDLYLIWLIRAPKGATRLCIIFVTPGICNSQSESNTFKQILAEPKFIIT
jgi:hypothetical protein